MRGFITDRDLGECERNFPGIVRFYRGMRDKPATFLQLLWAFHDACGCSSRSSDDDAQVESPAKLGH